MPRSGSSWPAQFMINVGPTVARYADVNCFNSGFGSLIIIDTVSQSKMVGIQTPAVFPVPGGATHSADRHSSNISGIILPRFLKYPRTIINPLNRLPPPLPILEMSAAVALFEDFSSNLSLPCGLNSDTNVASARK